MGKQTGGSAFPVPMPSSQISPCQNPGMTLRDWFAGQALAGLCADDFHDPVFEAKLAYEMADAMLEARNG